MSAINPGQIQTRRGTFGETTTTQIDLQSNYAQKPAIREMLEIKDKRYLSTLMTSGAIGSWGINSAARSKVPLADKAKGIGNNAYRFDVIGRIEKAAVILSQVGASGSDGSFQLKMADSHLYDGNIVRFQSGKQARVQGYPTGSSASGWIYNFKTITGSTFTFSTDVGSYLTCFPMYTAYSEGSLRGHSRDKKPDQFINHMTIQRKTIAITGSAQSDILWYEYAGKPVGWMYWKTDQMKATVASENDRSKFFGVSSMKASDGTLLAESSLGNDPETGLPIIMGDGWEEQVSGTNTMTGSGANGEATEDDFEDLMTTMQINSNQVDGLQWVAITGTRGFANANKKLASFQATQNTTNFQNITAGSTVEAGITYNKLNVNGNSVLFIIHPAFDDASQFPARGNDGNLLMSGTYFFMGINNNTPTMEILAKEANGVNRSYVEAKYVGLTGESGLIQSEQDATKIACLKEDMLVIYDPQTCGIIYKAS